MGILRDIFAGADTRAIVKLDTPDPFPSGSLAPKSHLNSAGSKPLRTLPIARKCIGYIADTINEAVPQIVDREGEVLQGQYNLPRWLVQPSFDYTLDEFVHQAVWSLFNDGNLKVLAATRKDGKPVHIYVGTSSVIQYVFNGKPVYLDLVNTDNQESTIVADSMAMRRRFALPGEPNGLSEIGPAKTLLEIALYAQDVLDHFFGENMFLDVIISPPPELEVLPKDAKKSLVSQLARRHIGTKRAFRPIITEAKWEIDRLRDSNQSNQLVELVGLINGMVCSQVFGIDPIVFSQGSHHSSSLTYQNSSNLRSQVWLQAVKPIAKLIAGCVSDFLPNGQRFEFSDHDLLLGKSGG